MEPFGEEEDPACHGPLENNRPHSVHISIYIAAERLCCVGIYFSNLPMCFFFLSFMSFFFCTQCIAHVASLENVLCVVGVSFSLNYVTKNAKIKRRYTDTTLVE